jgi:competence protein ComEC
MPRLFLLVASCFALGVAVVEWMIAAQVGADTMLYGSKSVAASCLIADAALMLLAFWIRGRTGKLPLLLLLAAACVTGSCYASAYEYRNAPRLDAQTGRDVVVQGRVVDDPVEKNGAWRCKLQITSIEGKAVAETLLLTIRPEPKKKWDQGETKETTTTAVPSTTDHSPPDIAQNSLQTSKQQSSAIPTQYAPITLNQNSLHTSKQQTSATPMQTVPPTTPTEPLTTPPPPIHYGDSIQLAHATLERFSPPHNPGGFDARAFYAAQDLFYSATARDTDLRILTRDTRGWTGRVLLPLRHRLLQALAAHFSPEHRAVLAGLLFGHTEEIGDDVMGAFRLLGVIHVLSVSGANLALWLMPLLYLLKKLGLPSRRRYILAILAILLYSGIAGAEPSVLRAAVMAILWCLGRLVARDADPLTSWSIAGMLTLLLSPRILTHLGFQLTMLLTIFLLLLPPRLAPLVERIPWLRRLPPRVLTALLLTLSAELISVPLVLTVNPVYTPLSLLANLYLIPLLALLVPVALVAVGLTLLHPALATLPALLCQELLDLLLHPLLYAGQWQTGVTHLRAPQPLWLGGYYAFWWIVAVSGDGRTRWQRLYRRSRKTGGALLGMLLIGFLLLTMFRPQPLRVTFLDVGQGDSSLIQMPQGQVWLVDGGGVPGAKPGDYDPGERVVVPALASYGIDRIDVLVLTHADEDHVRGLAAVIRQFRIGKALVSTEPGATDEKPFYRDLLQLLHEKGTPVERVHAGEVWTPEPNLVVTFWNPPPQPYQGTRSDSNANSVVFDLAYGQRRFLFTADLEGETEAMFPPKLPPVDVLKVAHHGSGHSSTLPFLQKISPSHAVISVGAHNRYGHPAASTLERLQQVGASVWRTDRQGSITVETDGTNLRISADQ